MAREVWREVPGFSGFHASSLGRISGRSGKVIAGRIDQDGYIRHSYYHSGERLDPYAHGLVAAAWLPPRPSDRHTVAHWDGSTTNNEPANLRWATPEEQHADKRRHGTDPKGSAHPNAKLTEVQAAEILATYRPRHAEFGCRALARKFGVSTYPIMRIVHGRGWTHIGAPK